MSAFAHYAQPLIELGYSPLPIIPGGKAPGSFTNADGWRPMMDWQRLCHEPPNHYQMIVWENWRDAGLGIALGYGGVICIDIDTDDEEMIAAIEAVLPELGVGKRGRKGRSWFFRGDTTKIVSRGFNINRIRVIDLLSTGKQTVIPPTIHPGTGKPYEWLTPFTLDGLRADELPWVDDDIAARLEEALTPFGYNKQDYRPPADPEERGETWGERVYFREINEDALANLEAWVPALSLYKCHRSPDGSYSAVADWRPSSSGQSLERRKPNLSIHPKGIIDYGDCDRTYTPLNLVMAAMGLPSQELDRAVKWLGERLGYDFSLKINLKLTSEIRDAAMQQDGDEVQAGTGPAAEPRVEQPFEPTQPVAPGEFDALAMEVGGLMGEMRDWILASAERPSPALTIGPIVTLMGAVLGRRHAGPTGRRTNLYALGLAPAGFGKDHARVCIQTLVAQAGLAPRLLGGKPASAGGLRLALVQKPSHLMMIDEVGSFIRAIHDKRANHLAELKEDMMELFTASVGMIAEKAYAKEVLPALYNPNLCFYGTSTAEAFWASMRASGVGDGFMPRFLMITADGEPHVGTPTAAADEPPKSLIAGLKRLCGGNLADFVKQDGNVMVKAHRMEWGPGGEDFDKDFHAYTESRRRLVPKEERPFWSRTREIGLKLAHIYALTSGSPVVEVEHIEWGAKLALAGARALVTGSRGRLAENDKHQEYLDVCLAISEAGPNGISRPELYRAVEKIEKRRIEDILDQAQIAERIYRKDASGPRGGRPTTRYYERCSEAA